MTESTEFMSVLCKLALMHAQVLQCRPAPQQGATLGHPQVFQGGRERPWWNVSASDVQNLKVLTLTHGNNALGYVLGPDGTVFQWIPEKHARNNSSYDCLRTIGRFHRNGDYIPIKQPVENGVREYQYDRMISAATIKCWTENKQWRMTANERQAFWCWAA
jgi:hypothetical protein